MVHTKTISNGSKYHNMLEDNYGVCFVHKTLSIPQSCPCTSCQSWCLSGNPPIKGFSTQSGIKIECSVCTLSNLYFRMCKLCS